MDRAAQQIEQYQQQQALMQRQNALHELPQQIRDADAERLRLKAMLRQNFRSHYQIIRKNSQALVQLTSTFEEPSESAVDPAVAREMIAKLARIEKLAHEIRESMAGHELPKVRPASGPFISPAEIAQTPASHRELLTTKANQTKLAAVELRNAVEKYLANDNEHAVSVDALKQASEKQHFDPNSLVILGNSLKLEQLSREIRTETRALYPSR
jgi:hypothetical protein